MGCSSYKSEWDCVEGLGAEKAQVVFEEHWSSFVSATDFSEMVSYGLNTVRIPIGYWIIDALVENDDKFPRGGFRYLKMVVGWAKAAGLLSFWIYTADQRLRVRTSHSPVNTPGFYSDSSYTKTYQFFTNLTTTCHTDPDFSTVFALEAINEPQPQSSKDPGMIAKFYPGVQKAVRAVEESLGVKCSDTGFDCLGV
ncbi:glycoside hydrolase [Meredithblackwellia eburnea MCA 4105]